MSKARTRRQKTPESILREEPPPYGSRKLVAVSLFSGGGGMDIGVESAGFTTAVSVESDEHAIETLRLRATRCGGQTRVIHADIRTLDPLDVATPGIALLHGGPPCQAFSLIGKRGSLDDERGLLLFEMIRFAKALEPQAILMEQVKGLLSAPDQTGEPGGVFRDESTELALNE